MEGREEGKGEGGREEGGRGKGGGRRKERGFSPRACKDSLFVWTHNCPHSREESRTQHADVTNASLYFTFKHSLSGGFQQNPQH